MWYALEIITLYARFQATVKPNSLRGVLKKEEQRAHDIIRKEHTSTIQANRGTGRSGHSASPTWQPLGRPCRSSWSKPPTASACTDTFRCLASSIWHSLPFVSFTGSCGSGFCEGEMQFQLVQRLQVERYAGCPERSAQFYEVWKTGCLHRTRQFRERLRIY